MSEKKRDVRSFLSSACLVIRSSIVYFEKSETSSSVEEDNSAFRVRSWSSSQRIWLLYKKYRSPTQNLDERSWIDQSFGRRQQTFVDIRNRRNNWDDKPTRHNAWRDQMLELAKEKECRSSWKTLTRCLLLRRWQLAQWPVIPNRRK